MHPCRGVRSPIGTARAVREPPLPPLSSPVATPFVPLHAGNVLRPCCVWRGRGRATSSPSAGSPLSVSAPALISTPFNGYNAPLTLGWGKVMGQYRFLATTIAVALLLSVTPIQADGVSPEMPVESLQMPASENENRVEALAGVVEQSTVSPFAGPRQPE